MTRLPYALLLLLLLVLAGCSNSNSDAPPAGAAHPDGWILAHAAEARVRLDGCQVCHGLAFAGSGDAVSCFSCHPTGPPFTLHPGGWVDIVAEHQAFALTISWTTCATAACHGPTLEGGIAGPSCFNVVCHGPEGNPPAPHVLPFADPAAHGPTAKTNQFFCRNCHGRPANDFNGGFVADLFADPARIEINPTGNCSLCHPSAKAHPTSWQGGNDPDPVFQASHRGIDVTTQSVSCALCHLTTGPGLGPVPAAPSCFSASHTNADNSTTICHAGGPRTAPHPVDGSFRAPAAHGRQAKQDLTFCQNCHAVPGISGPGSNPRFNVAIGTLVAGCETCHPPFRAHPGIWAGPNPANVFHYQSGNIANACTLCHGVNLDGVGGVDGNGGSPGLSCRQCHADTTLFNLNCTACHGYPPDGVTAEPRVAVLGGVPVNHDNPLGPAANVAEVALHDQCAVCHGVKSSATSTSGHLSPSANYRTFDVLTGVPGDHWNGQINMNGPSPATGAGYNETNFGCDNAGCHINDAAHQLSDSALPVQFADYGRGGGGAAPHPLDGTFRLGENHGPVARTDLTNCKACHGQATTTNPRYNVGIGGTGCETCHNDGTAHPSFRVGGREAVHWYDVQWRHSNGTKSTFATACSMCHPGIGGTGTVGPACLTCHRASPILNNSGCVSCHSLPPNGVSGIAGNQRPNRTGNHSRSAHRTGISSTPLNTCGVCHGTAFGPGNVNHFDQTSPANVIMTGDGAGISVTQSASNTTCTGTCHGENHQNESWY
jgi:hypothetical protein